MVEVERARIMALHVRKMSEVAERSGKQDAPYCSYGSYSTRHSVQAVPTLEQVLEQAST